MFSSARLTLIFKLVSSHVIYDLAWCWLYIYTYISFRIDPLYPQQDSFPNNKVDVTQVGISIPEQPDPAKRFAFTIDTDKKLYPVAAEKNEDMFNWLHALRRAKLWYKYLNTSVDDDTKEIPFDKSVQYKDIIQGVDMPRFSGELVKQGGHWKSWNKRYFVLHDGTLYYFKNKPMNADVSTGVVGCLWYLAASTLFF